MPKLMKRRRIRKAELLEIVCRMKISSVDESNKVAEIKDAIAWLGYCECGNEHGLGNGMFLGKVEYDHRIPNAQLYEGDDIYWRALLPACHAKKTKLDNARTAKAKRQAGEKGQQARRRRNGPSMKSRGFGESRGFDKKPPGYKHKWGKRKLTSRNTFKE